MTTPRTTSTAQSANAAYRRFCERRDPAAIAELFDLAATDLRRTAMHLVGDAATADDLVQTTFLCAIQSRAFDPTRDVMPWLAGILRNQASLVHRRRARRFDPERLRLEPCEDPSIAASEWETQREIESALAQLGDAYQPVVRLHLFHGLEAGAIAASLGRPGGTVRTQLMRGLEKLRELLPVGIAGAVAGLLPSIGMAATRAAIVTAAGGSSATVATGASVTTTSASWGSGRIAVAALLLTAAIAAPFAWPSDDIAAPEASTEIVADAGGPQPADSRFDAAAAANAIAAEDTQRIAAPTPADATRGVFELRGFVRDSKGDPVEGAEVLAFPENRPFFADEGFSPAPKATATSGADGSYAIVMPFAGCYAIARAPGMFCEHAVEGAAAGRERIDGIDFRLVPTVKQNGIVVDERGRGRPGLPITTPLHGPATQERSLAAEGFVTAQLPRIATRTDERGRFSASVVKNQLYTYTTSSPTVPFVSKTKSAEQGEVRLVAPTGAVVRGAAFRADGSPAAGAKVRLQMKPERLTTCDAQGRFELVGCHRDDSVVLFVEDEASAIWCRTMGKDDDTLRVSLEQPRRLSGRILDAAGAPVEGAFVRIRGDRTAGQRLAVGIEPTWEIHHRISSTKTAADGTFAIDRLYDGVFAIEARMPSEQTFLDLGTQRSGLPQRDFVTTAVLAATATLRGRAIDALTREPIPALRIGVLYRDSDGNWQGQMHDVECNDGAFELRGLKTGNAQLTASAQGYSDAIAVERSLVAGSHTFDVALSPTCSLRVRATSGGAPVRAVASVIRDDGAEVLVSTGASSTTGAMLVDGEAILRAVPRERIRVRVRGVGYVEATQEIDLRTATEIVDVTFEVHPAEQVAETPRPSMDLYLLAMLCIDEKAERDFAGTPDERWLQRVTADPRYTTPDAPIDVVVRDAAGKQIASARITPASGFDPATGAIRTGFTSEGRSQDGSTTQVPSSTYPSASLRVLDERVVVEFSCAGRATRRVELTRGKDQQVPVAVALPPTR